GPRLLGLVFNWGLLGVLTTQVYVYHLSASSSPTTSNRAHNAAVYIVYVLDWVQTSSATYDAFQWFVYGWGNIPALYGVYTNFLNVPILSSTIGSIVQIFFGWRIWTISQSWIPFAVVMIFSCLQLGAGGVVGYYLYQDASETARSAGLVRAVGIRLGASAVVDTIIAGCMTYFVSAAMFTGFQTRLRNVLTRLIRLTIETGTVTAISAVVDLVFFLKAHNALHQVSGVILCKLYSNTLLVLFNNRLAMANEHAR
ncbi:hypothetical protein K438DRAFT_1488382, partial [Mycena galopus ATCC 62051]